MSGGRTIGSAIRRYRLLYLMMVPAVAYLFVLKYLPIFGLMTAFRDYHPTMGLRGFFTAPWIGLRNFGVFFGSYYSGQILANTIIISGLKILFIFPAPIVLALVVNEMRSEAFKRTVQTVTYLPHFISWVVIGGILFDMLSISSGSLNILLEKLIGHRMDFLGNPRLFRGILVVSELWKEVGWGSIIYLAAIAGIDAELYEAAVIDGAGHLGQVWHITLPGILPTITVLFLLRIAAILDAGFEQILILYSPPVYEVADIIDTYVYRVGLTQGRYGVATAAGLFKSAIGLAMVVGANKLVRWTGQKGLY
jgi:putative aldouronate transport system permease protein